MERDFSKQNKHVTIAGDTLAQPVPGLLRLLSASSFIIPHTHTQITNLATLHSASTTFCKQRLDAPEGFTSLVHADACEEHPHSGENQWQWLPQAKSAMGCSTQDPEQSPACHICHGDRSRAAPCNLVALATFRALLHKCSCKGGADSTFPPLTAALPGCPTRDGHHSRGDSHELDESRPCPIYPISKLRLDLI